jgi:hypothetical protein
MKMQDKHKSKLHKGFIKQVRRQDQKPSEIKINLPMAIELPKNFKGSYKHHIRVYNEKWNGMNLKKLCNSFSQVMPDWMYSKFAINSEGKYILSRYGKEFLKKKKLKRENKLVTK